MGDNNDSVALDQVPTRPSRNVPLILLAVFATVFVLDWAQPVLMPLVLGLITAMPSAPSSTASRGFPFRAALSAVVLLALDHRRRGRDGRLAAGRGRAVSSETLPEAVQKFQRAAREEFGGSGTRSRRCSRRPTSWSA